MKTNEKLMAEAREALKGNWKKIIQIAFAYLVITGAIGLISLYLPKGIQPLFTLIGYIVAAPVILGFAKLFINIARKQEFSFKDILSGFSDFGRALGTGILYLLLIILWSLLLVIPGIIAQMAYAQAYFLLVDNKKLGSVDAISQSKAMMKGCKWKYFCLGFRFLGWGLLCVGFAFLCIMPYIQSLFSQDMQAMQNLQYDPKYYMLSFLGSLPMYLFLYPYLYTTYAKFYEDVKAEYEGNQGSGAVEPKDEKSAQATLPETYQD